MSYLDTLTLSIVEALMTDAQDATDPWGSRESTFVNSTSSDDPWASWTSTNSAAVDTNVLDDPWASLAMNDSAAGNVTSSNDPLADTSSPFISSQVQSMASETTAASHPTEQSFTGVNTERLAILDAGEEYEDEIVQEPTYVSKGTGENVVELPFNRLATMNRNENSDIDAEDKFEESDISEEE